MRMLSLYLSTSCRAKSSVNICITVRSRLVKYLFILKNHTLPGVKCREIERHTERSPPLDPLQFYGAPRANIRPSQPTVLRGMDSLSAACITLAELVIFLLETRICNALSVVWSLLPVIRCRQRANFYRLSHQRRIAVTALYTVEKSTLCLTREWKSPNKFTLTAHQLH